MIVVDTNVIAYLLIEGEYTPHAEALFMRDSHWLAPLLWRSEFRNVLAQYMRGGQLSRSAALQLMTEAEELMSGGEYEPASADVLSCVDESACPAYDCEFLTLARRLEVPLFTSDKGLLAAFPASTIDLKQLLKH